MSVQKVILIVENNTVNRIVLSTMLSSQYKILEAVNGREALYVLKKHKDEIALVLLNLVLPVIDGYTLLKTMKNDPSCESIPVIVITQNDSVADEINALSLGAADFVPIPLKSQVIMPRIAGIIHLRETAAMINQFQYDSLTGLYSKAYFYQKARELINQNPHQEYDIVCSDIENFKLINDVFGLPAGDQLLCGIADLFREILSGKGLYGRLNADQFVCLLKGGYQYTDEIFVAFGDRVNALSITKNVTLKWGIYSLENRDITVEQMCDRALLAANSIKGQYGKYYAEYDDKLRGGLLRRQAIIDSMETALAEEQFSIYLQPKYHIADNKLSGAEALVRWLHPEWGPIPPTEFIPLFEENGFITKLDQFVWDKTCVFLRQWDSKGYPAIAVSVNVSRADIYNDNIAGTLLDIVRKHNLSPSRLHLEITESAYTENPRQLIETISHLRSLGFVVEMDDFGSGYSSLNMLNKLPIDIIKLDMKFIQSETEKPLNQGILQFIMDLARGMHLSVVAEGVETREQLERLLDVGCDYVQGYFYAKPMPGEEFETLMKEQKADPEREEPCIEKQKEDSGLQKILLIADENEAYRNEVRKTFAEFYQVVEAVESDEALNYILDHRDRLAAVLLSTTLSGPDGFTVLEKLKTDNRIWNIPIIAAGEPDEGLEEKALELGAADYIKKPHTQRSLWLRVRRATKLNSYWEQEQIWQKEACQDHLTHILNRRGWEASVNALHMEDVPMAVCLFDLDHLKQINDTFGHVEGDHVIEVFGRILSTKTRDTDVVSRYGGDEFAVIIRQTQSEEEALKKGEEICQAFLNDPEAQKSGASASGGIVLLNVMEPMDEVIKKADAALYQAKKECKGSCWLWKEKRPNQDNVV